jgi:hypothetical protein
MAVGGWLRRDRRPRRWKPSGDGKCAKSAANRTLRIRHQSNGNVGNRRALLLRPFQCRTLTRLCSPGPAPRTSRATTRATAVSAGTVCASSIVGRASDAPSGSAAARATRARPTPRWPLDDVPAISDGTRSYRRRAAVAADFAGHRAAGRPALPPSVRRSIACRGCVADGALRYEQTATTSWTSSASLSA